jgi:hypothetical protein
MSLVGLNLRFKYVCMKMFFIKGCSKSELVSMHVGLVLRSYHGVSKTRGSIIQDVKWININLLLTTMWMMSLQFLKN